MKSHRLTGACLIALSLCLIAVCTIGMASKISLLEFDQKAKLINAGGLNLKGRTQIENVLTQKQFTKWTLHNQEYLKKRITFYLYNYDFFNQRNQNILAKEQLEYAMTDIKSFLTTSPTSSNHWFLLTLSSYILNNKTVFNQQALELSYLTGPREGWIARRRMQFTYNQIERLEDRFHKYMKNEFKSFGWGYKDDAVRLAQGAPNVLKQHFNKPSSYSSEAVFKYVRSRINSF